MWLAIRFVRGAVVAVGSDDLKSHVFSNESSKNLDETREQRFDSGLGGGCVRVDSRGQLLSRDAGRLLVSKLLEHRMQRRTSRGCPTEERVATVLAHRLAHIVQHDSARVIERVGHMIATRRRFPLMGERARYETTSRAQRRRGRRQWWLLDYLAFGWQPDFPRSAHS